MKKFIPKSTFKEYFRKVLEDNVEVAFITNSEVPAKAKVIEEKIIALEEALASLEGNSEEYYIENTMDDEKLLKKQLAPSLLGIRKELENMDVEGIEIKLIQPIYSVSKVVFNKVDPQILLEIEGYTAIIPDILKYQENKEDTDNG